MFCTKAGRRFSVVGDRGRRDVGGGAEETSFDTSMLSLTI